MPYPWVGCDLKIARESVTRGLAWSGSIPSSASVRPDPITYQALSIVISFVYLSPRTLELVCKGSCRIYWPVHGWQAIRMAGHARHCISRPSERVLARRTRGSSDTACAHIVLLVIADVLVIVDVALALSRF